MIKGSRNYPILSVWIRLPCHRIGLPRTCLSISKDSSIIPLQYAVDDWASTLLVDPRLHVLDVGISVAVVKGEHLWLLRSDFGVVYLDLSIFLVDKNDDLPLLLLFMTEHGTTSDDNLDAFGLLFDSDFFLFRHLKFIFK